MVGRQFNGRKSSWIDHAIKLRQQGENWTEIGQKVQRARKTVRDVVTREMHARTVAEENKPPASARVTYPPLPPREVVDEACRLFAAHKIDIAELSRRLRGERRA